MITKSYALAEVKAAETDDPNGAFEAILSAPTLDRDGEIIDAKAFEPLPDHITIDMDHGLSMATTIGSGEPYYDGDILKVRGTFSSIARAQEARALVAEGHIRTMSVAFIRSESTSGSKTEPPHVKRAELLNAAFVAVPSNRDALVLTAKAMDIKATKGDRLQGIHDLAVQNGAVCSAAKSTPEPAPVAEPTTPTVTPEDAAAKAAATPPDEAEERERQAQRVRAMQYLAV